MLAVDTNVLVRLLIADDPVQLSTARSLFEQETIWIGNTVLLETDWVLSSSYRVGPEARRGAFERLLSLPNVEFEARYALVDALALTMQGVSFADALHLSSRRSGTRFLSFDRTFCKRAQRAAVTDIYDAASYLSR
jgi:predicted nucleic-acid-binding protein